MSLVVSGTTEAPESGITKRTFPRSRPRARAWFYGAAAGTLLLIVLVGFSHTLYLRSFFDVPTIPTYLYWHGVILTAWYAGLLMQVLLIRFRCTKVHRQLGWGLSAVAVGVIAISTYVTLNFVPRQRALGVDVATVIGTLSDTVWTNLSQVAVFSGLVSAAVLLRRRPEWHKRFMVLASMSIVTPALSGNRLGFFIPVFKSGVGTIPAATVRFALLVMLVVGVAIYDVMSSKRLHPATLVGGAIVIGLRLVASSAIATSAFGRSFVFGL